MKRKLLSLVTLLSILLISGAVFAKSPKAKATTGGTLRLSTELSHPYLPVNTTQDVYSTIRVTAGPAVATGERAPLNIALVVDRSTSMSGGKLEQAKMAATRLVDVLAPTDRLAIVSYGSDVKTELESMLATPDNKEMFYNAINNIQLSGSTNLSGGYERGVTLIRPHQSDETVNRVMLLSDGRANAGIVNKDQLGLLVQRHLEEGISLSTMGIGLDYNEDLMTHIAIAGAGNYYFIENEKAMAAILEKEAKGLSSTVARKTVLTIEVSPGVELLEIEGFAYKLKGNKATVRLSEFYANQTKDILARMSVTTGASGAMPIVKTRLSFDDVAQDKRRSSTTNLVAVATSDQKLAKTKVNKPVMKRVQQVRVAKSMNDAMTAWEKGDQKQAKKILAEQRAEIKQNASSYDFEDDASFQRVEGELKAMEKTVTRSSASSSAGKRARKQSKKRSYDIANEAALF